MSYSWPQRRGEAPFDFYPYNPSKIGGWVFLILFGIASVTHIIQVFWHRSWFFIVFFLGCVAETGGYYARQWAHNHIRLSDPYLMQLFLLIGAVPLISASVYMTLPRLVRTLDAEEYIPMRTSWISKIYILIDIACLALQIILRNAIRVIEFLQGTDGTIASNEAYLYIFDAVPMFLVVLILAILHPGRLLKAANRSGGEGEPGGDGMTIPLTREK
ncbi:hypothetical protein D0860_01580 [Hortaea werneckii]|uniref:RTA1 domain protein n=1 Tax=Hortaea werneckii TaxID=91943 RepID=A0A3M7HQ16_HORWE|nr:hypothetical protein D0860_01580 [Hortaea werneckii]